LVYIANDGWVANNYLSSFHFYHSRLRAVETRKDVILNSNMGICGKVSSSGKIEIQHHFDTPGLLTVQGTLNQLTSWYTCYPYLWYVLLCLCTLPGILYYLFINPKNNKK
jgi:apolipoprotein N-acyltransferase